MAKEMEIDDIEKLIGECKASLVPRSGRAETLDIVGGIMQMRSNSDVFSMLLYNHEVNDGNFPIGVYSRLAKGTMEDGMARFAILLFRLANKYHMNVKALRLDGKTASKDFEELMFSMVKIGMTHYKIQKKIIILIGMLLSFCASENIDLLWFVNKRLLLDAKK